MGTQYVGQSNTKSLQTAIAWSRADNIAFIVQAALKNGNTTFANEPFYGPDNN